MEASSPSDFRRSDAEPKEICFGEEEAAPNTSRPCELEGLDGLRESEGVEGLREMVGVVGLESVSGDDTSTVSWDGCVWEGCASSMARTGSGSLAGRMGGGILSTMDDVAVSTSPSDFVRDFPADGSIKGVLHARFRQGRDMGKGHQ